MGTEFVGMLQHRDNGDTAIVGATPFDQEILADLQTNKAARIDFTFARNLQFHKKFFVLLKLIYDYMDESTRERLDIHDPKVLLIRLKIDLGLFTLHITAEDGMVPAGTPVYIPDSISFAKMDDSKFETFYKGVIGVAIGKYVTNQTEESMMQAVNAVLRFE